MLCCLHDAELLLRCRGRRDKLCQASKACPEVEDHALADTDETFRRVIGFDDCKANVMVCRACQQVGTLHEVSLHATYGGFKVWCLSAGQILNVVRPTSCITHSSLYFKAFKSIDPADMAGSGQG